MGATSGLVNTLTAAQGKMAGYRKELDTTDITKEALIDSIFPFVVGTGLSKAAIRQTLNKVPATTLLEKYPEYFTGRRAREAIEKQLISKNQGLLERGYENVTRKYAPGLAGLLTSTNKDNLISYLKNPEEIALIRKDPLAYAGELGRKAQKYANIENMAPHQRIIDKNSITKLNTSQNAQTTFNNKMNAIIERIQKTDEAFPYLPFGSLRDTLPDVLRTKYSDDLASMALQHGELTNDTLLQCYTNKPFGKLFEATRELREYFRPMLEALHE
jgi:ribosomal protein S17E